jgi:spermidine/putrescine transport system permease protein
LRSDAHARLRDAALGLLGAGAALVVVAVGVLAAAGQLAPRDLVALAAAFAVVAALARRTSTARLLAAYSAFVYVVLMTPIVVVVAYAFNANRLVTIWDGVTLDWFGRALADDSIRLAIERSLQISLASTLVSACIGCAAALSLSRAPRAIRTAVESITLLALAIPEVVIAISLLLFFSDLGFPLGTVTMFLGHTLYGVALVTLVVRARLVTIGPALQEASLDLGASPLATFRQVTFPQLRPAIVAGALLSFTFSFDDVVMSAFTSGAGNETWPLRILSALRFGLSPELNATAAMMLAVTLVALVAAGVLLRRSVRPRAAA